MDLWNNEILSYSLSSKRGDRMTYISGLTALLISRRITRILKWFFIRIRDRGIKNGNGRRDNRILPQKYEG
jgi:hypothetical protein